MPGQNHSRYQLTNTRLTAAFVTSTLPKPVLVSAKLCQDTSVHSILVSQTTTPDSVSMYSLQTYKNIGLQYNEKIQLNMKVTKY